MINFSVRYSEEVSFDYQCSIPKWNPASALNCQSPRRRLTDHKCESLKPQDSLGRFVKNILDLQKVDHTQKAPLNPPAIVLNEML